MADNTWELISADGQHKAVVRLRQDRLYEVALCRWTREVVPDYGEVATFWEEVERPSLTDTSANTTKLAEESLRRYSHGTPP